MHLLQTVLGYFWYYFCRHEWVRDRDESGQLVRRCMNCGNVKPDTMTMLVRWRPDYDPIEPSKVTGLAIPAQDLDGKDKSRKWRASSFRPSESGQRRSAA